MFRFKRNQILVISDLHSSKKNMNSKELNIYKKPQRKQNDKIYIYIYFCAFDYLHFQNYSTSGLR